MKKSHARQKRAAANSTVREISTGPWQKNFYYERDPAGKSEPDQPEPKRIF